MWIARTTAAFAVFTAAFAFSEKVPDDVFPLEGPEDALKAIAAALNDIFGKVAKMSTDVIQTNEPELVRLLRWATLTSIRRAAEKIERGEWPSRLEDVEVDFELPVLNSNGSCGDMDPKSSELPPCVSSLKFSYVPVKLVPIEGQPAPDENATAIIGNISEVSRLSETDDYTDFEKANSIKGHMAILPPRVAASGAPVELPPLTTTYIKALLDQLQAVLEKYSGFAGFGEASHRIPMTPNALLKKIQHIEEGSGIIPDESSVEGSGESSDGEWQAQIQLDMLHSMPGLFGIAQPVPLINSITN